MRIFILEDDPMRQTAFIQALIGHELTMVDSVLKAKQAWKPPYDLVLLDHDLGGQQMVDSEEENTGYQFCVFLQGQDFYKEEMAVVIHSYNPEGAIRMYRLLVDDGYYPARIPFGPQLLGWLARLQYEATGKGFEE